MIFVTVGTHEQPFNRLLKQVDLLVKSGVINETVIVQSGFSDYIPQHCINYKFLSLKEMTYYINNSRIVITHGGPASFIEALRAKKVPIVVPRMEKYNEHINNHQVEFVKLIYSRKHNILPVYDVSELANVIANYDSLISNIDLSRAWNNVNFNKHLELIVRDIFRKGKNNEG